MNLLFAHHSYLSNYVLYRNFMCNLNFYFLTSLLKCGTYRRVIFVRLVPARNKVTLPKPPDTVLYTV